MFLSLLGAGLVPVPLVSYTCGLGTGVGGQKAGPLVPRSLARGGAGGTDTVSWIFLAAPFALGRVHMRNTFSGCRLLEGSGGRSRREVSNIVPPLQKTPTF